MRPADRQMRDALSPRPATPPRRAPGKSLAPHSRRTAGTAAQDEMLDANAADKGAWRGTGGSPGRDGGSNRRMVRINPGSAVCSPPFRLSRAVGRATYAEFIVEPCVGLCHAYLTNSVHKPPPRRGPAAGGRLHRARQEHWRLCLFYPAARDGNWLLARSGTLGPRLCSSITPVTAGGRGGPRWRPAVISVDNVGRRSGGAEA